jgi:hypothetical protein
MRKRFAGFRAKELCKSLTFVPLGMHGNIKHQSCNDQQVWHMGDDVSNITFCYQVQQMFDDAEALLNCTAFVDLLKNWIHIGKICSMQIERMLALIKKSATEDTVNVEKLTSSGFLTQWNVKHLAAGGQSAKFRLTKDLVKAGAPLKCATTARKNLVKKTGKRRGHILFANRVQADVQRRGVTLSRELAATMRSEASSAFKGLSADMRERFTHASHHNPNNEPFLPDAPELERYNTCDGQLLMGLSTPKFAIDPDKAEKFIIKQLGDDCVGGFTKYEKLLREQFMDLIFIPDAGRS